MTTSDTGTSTTRTERLLAVMLVHGKKQVEQIALLTLAGFEPKDIADLLGTTPNTVSVTLSKARKAGRLKMPTLDGQEK